MRKKNFIFFFALIIFSAIFSLKTFAEEKKTGLSKEYQDYLSSLADLNENYKFYLNLTNQYQINSSTLVENDLLPAAKNLLISRSVVVENYLVWLRKELAETTGVLDYQENLAYIYLDNQKVEALKFKNEIESSNDLTTLNNLGQIYGKKYAYTKKISYKALGIINNEKITNQIQSLLSLVEKTKKLIQKTVFAKEKSVIFDSGLAKIESALKSLQLKQNSEFKKFLLNVDRTENGEDSLNNFNFFLSEMKNWVSTLTADFLNLISLF